MKFVLSILFTLSVCLCRSQVTAVVQATFTDGDCFSYAEPFDGCLNDSVFACSRYTYLAFLAGGNAGEYATVRFTVGGVNYGMWKIYAGSPVNLIPNSKPNGYAVITLGTLTEFINEAGDTIAPFVETYAYR